MRSPLVKQTILGAVGILVSGCSSPSAGPSLTEATASATPPSVLSTQPNLPAASSFYPTGHSSLQPPSSDSKPVPAAAPNLVASGELTAKPSSASTLNATGNTTDTSDSSDSSSKIDVSSNFDNLDIIDPDLKKKLAVLRVGSDPTSNDLLSVFAGLKNRTSHPLALEVQTLYKDKDGNPLNDGSWVPMTLKAHEETEYRSSSISAQATDFLVRVRNASQPKAN